MKFSSLVPILCVALLTAWGCPLPAQTTDNSDAETTAPPGSTVITSDQLHSDQNTHTSIFTGNVVVVGNQFRMTCQEMTVYFTNDNKVDRIVSTGDVVITQPDRVTHCGHAEYFHDDDKFVLTEQPVILNGKDTMSNPSTIIIYRTDKKIVTPPGSGRTTVVLAPGSMGTPTPPPPTATNK
jgi:lipopolysaccharide transport protein LptA